MTSVHDFCPEERTTIGQTSVQYCNWFLKEMSEEVGLGDPNSEKEGQEGREGRAGKVEGQWLRGV